MPEALLSKCTMGIMWFGIKGHKSKMVLECECRYSMKAMQVNVILKRVLFASLWVRVPFKALFARAH